MIKIIRTKKICTLYTVSFISVCVSLVIKEKSGVRVIEELLSIDHQRILKRGIAELYMLCSMQIFVQNLKETPSVACRFSTRHLALKTRGKGKD